MTFEITILGCGAAMPSARNRPAAQIVNVHDNLFLVDCGEGTQMQMRQYKVKFQRIHHIFISHLHGDHFFGLPGLISSLNLLGRKSTLHIYGPPALKDVIEMNFLHSETFLDFGLEFHPMEYDKKNLILEDTAFQVYSFPLKHRIPCTGFLFVEKEKPLKIRKDKIEEFRLSPLQIVDLKNGKSVELKSGQRVTSDDVCLPREKNRSYAYCSDTIYWEKLVEFIADVDLLYHESTFLESEKERAKKTLHSTASQAAQLGVKAGAAQLLLGHFSSRYKNVGDFLEEAGRVHPNVLVAEEGGVIQVGKISNQIIST